MLNMAHVKPNLIIRSIEISVTKSDVNSDAENPHTRHRVHQSLRNQVTTREQQGSSCSAGRWGSSQYPGERSRGLWDQPAS